MDIQITSGRCQRTTESLWLQRWEGKPKANLGKPVRKQTFAGPSDAKRHRTPCSYLGNQSWIPTVLHPKQTRTQSLLWLTEITTHSSNKWAVLRWPNPKQAVKGMAKRCWKSAKRNWKENQNIQNLFLFHLLGFPLVEGKLLSVSSPPPPFCCSFYSLQIFFFFNSGNSRNKELLKRLKQKNKKNQPPNFCCLPELQPTRFPDILKQVN